jgi:hypothetical protein
LPAPHFQETGRVLACVLGTDVMDVMVVDNQLMASIVNAIATMQSLGIRR